MGKAISFTELPDYRGVFTRSSQSSGSNKKTIPEWNRVSDTFGNSLKINLVEHNGVEPSEFEGLQVLSPRLFEPFPPTLSLPIRFYAGIVAWIEGDVDFVLIDDGLDPIVFQLLLVHGGIVPVP